MTERAQALEAAVRALIEPMCERVTDNGIVRQKMLVVAGDDAFDRYRRVVELLAVQPPPPVGSPTTEHEHDYVTVELCRHCLRTEADITGQCHHCDEGTGARCWWCLRLKSPAHVSPVEPTPELPTETECCHALITADERLCQKCGYEARIQPTRAPAPCVWRDAPGGAHVYAACTPNDPYPFLKDEARQFSVCPYCAKSMRFGHPLTVER